MKCKKNTKVFLETIYTDQVEVKNTILMDYNICT